MTRRPAGRGGARDLRRQPTLADQGGDDTRDSDFFGAGNRTAIFEFPVDGSIDHLDAGFHVLFHD